MSRDRETILASWQAIIELPDTPKPSSVWKHYKGDFYIVIGIVMRESSHEIEVCYESLESESSLHIQWIRPLREWTETIINCNGKNVKRFTKVEM